MGAVFFVEMRAAMSTKNSQFVKAAVVALKNAPMVEISPRAVNRPVRKQKPSPVFELVGNKWVKVRLAELIKTPEVAEFVRLLDRSRVSTKRAA